MAVAWYLALYGRMSGRNGPNSVRYCAMDDFTGQILAQGGAWSETEVLGDAAIVKVRADAALLTTIAADSRMTRIPLAALNDSLSSLTTGQRNAIRTRILALGYTQAEFEARLGTNLAALTVGQVLRFAATRRLKPRYDVPTQAIVFTTEVQECRSVDDVDVRVT